MKKATKLIGLFLSVLLIAVLFCGVTAFAAETDYTSPTADEAKIYGANVNLGGDISMKYYVEVGSNITVDNLKLKTEFLGVVKELSATSTETIDTVTYHVYVLDSINPQCMGDPIDAQLIYNGAALTCEDSSILDYSVKQNLVNIYETSDDKTKQLIIDTLEYGAAAQIYQNYNSEETQLVTYGVDFIANDVAESTPSANTYEYTGATENIYLDEVTVNFSNTNQIKIKYLNNSENVTELSVAIAPYDFSEKATFTVENGFTLKYSINDYCYEILNGDYTENMKDLALALYNYGLSAHKYVGVHSGGTATCSQGKLCDICGFEYDTTRNPNNHASDELTYTANEDETHSAVCSYCNTEYVTNEAHTFDAATGKCTSCEVAAAAKIGEKYYAKLANAVAVEGGGDVYVLANNDEDFTIPGNVNLYAGENTLSGDILVKGIIKDGIFTGKVSLCYSGKFVNGVATTIDPATIEGGAFYGAVSASEDGGGGYIKGGTFYDTLTTSAIAITGGIFTESATVELTGYTMVEGAAIFYCDVDNKDSFIISGTFYGTVENREDGWIYGGDFKDALINYGYITNKQDDYTITITQPVQNELGSTIDCTEHIQWTEASCAVKATCGICGEYGETLPHNYSYVANDDTDTITESCDQGCGHNVTVTLKAPANLVYDESKKEATIDGTLAGAYAITYAVKDGATLDSAPATVGTYTATLTVGDKSVSVEFTIEKADPPYTEPTGLTANLGQTLADVALPTGWAWEDDTLSVGAEGENEFNAVFTPADTANYNTITKALTVSVSMSAATVTTEPAAVENLEYTGEARALVTAGTASGGEVQYKLGADGTYSTAIPTATDVGEYTVYWKVVGDDNHGDTAEQSITVTISANAVAEEELNVTGYDASYTYTGEAIKPEDIIITVDGKELVKDTDYEISYGENQYVGEGTITITFKGNYSGEVVKTFAITQQDETLPFDGEGVKIS
ncbi:MAG: hypothetical protein IJZ80_02270 [Clostridia bacterium]|nr:hypothetical protein [Clostridia bacterium]